MSERASNQHEHQPKPETESRQHEQDRPPVEHGKAETEPDWLETAREQVERAAETEPADRAETTRPDAAPTRITNQDKTRAYQQTLRLIQRGLPTLSRGFSRIIHQPAIERLSELGEKTIARPSGLLGGGLAATVGLAIMLFYARRNGFALSGSELALFLVIGWGLGLLAEFTGKKLSRRR